MSPHRNCCGCCSWEGQGLLLTHSLLIVRVTAVAAGRMKQLQLRTSLATDLIIDWSQRSDSKIKPHARQNSLRIGYFRKDME